MSEQEIEQEIQDKGLNAPRLRPADIDAAILGETFTILPSGKVMVCELTLVNGFTVRGESACVSIANFDEGIGMKISRENARNKVWELEGYRLQCDLERNFDALVKDQKLLNALRSCGVDNWDGWDMAIEQLWDMAIDQLSEE